MRLRLAIFDIDGTLIDSGATICRAMGAAFAEQGLPRPDDAAIRAIIGLSLQEAVATIQPSLPAPAVREVAAAYARQYRPIAAEPPLYQGARALLDRLDGRDVLIAAATGKSRRGLDNAFAQHGIGHLFLTSRTADECPGKPHPAMIEDVMAVAGVSPEDAVMIGDTSFDMAMARNAGCAAIGVGWGYHEVEALRDAGAMRIVDTMAGLEQALVSHWGLS